MMSLHGSCHIFLCNTIAIYLYLCGTVFEMYTKSNRILPNVEFPSASVLTVEYPQAAMDHMTGNRDQITFKLAMMTLALLDSPYNM